MQPDSNRIDWYKPVDDVVCSLLTTATYSQTWSRLDNSFQRHRYLKRHYWPHKVWIQYQWGTLRYSKQKNTVLKYQLIPTRTAAEEAFSRQTDKTTEWTDRHIEWQTHRDTRRLTIRVATACKPLTIQQYISKQLNVSVDVPELDAAGSWRRSSPDDLDVGSWTTTDLSDNMRTLDDEAGLVSVDVLCSSDHITQYPLNTTHSLSSDWPAHRNSQQSVVHFWPSRVCNKLPSPLCSVRSTDSFYRAMHFSAKRGIAIACHLSVRPSVRRVSVCL